MSRSGGGGGGAERALVQTLDEDGCVTGWAIQVTGDFAVSDPLAIGEIDAPSASGLLLADDSGTPGLFVEDGGEVGIGHVSPMGALDVRDAIGGHIFSTRTAIDTTAQLLLEVGAVTQYIRCDAIVSNGTTRGYLGFALQMGGTITQNVATSPDTYQIRLNVDGSVDVLRTAGSNLGTIVFRAMWI